MYGVSSKGDESAPMSGDSLIYSPKATSEASCAGAAGESWSDHCGGDAERDELLRSFSQRSSMSSVITGWCMTGLWEMGGLEGAGALITDVLSVLLLNMFK